jgi:dihydroorotase
MFDLLITGGRVIDPAQEMDSPFDIGVSEGRIAQVGPGLPRDGAKKVVDVSGKLVTPGLIDLHCHLYEAVTPYGVAPDRAGVSSGVTTLVDAGSSGAANFEGFRRLASDPAGSNVLCFLNIALTGLSVVPEIRSASDIDVGETVKVALKHPELIQGIKVRPIGPATRSLGLDMVRRAKEAARESQSRLMVHITEPRAQEYPSLTRGLLPLLEPGDILSHPFSGKPGSVLTPEGLMPEFREAAARGVVLDSANAAFYFSYRVARAALEAGIMPTTLSTDMATLRGLYSAPLTQVMSQSLALGLELGRMVEMVTVAPARVLGMADRLGSLAPGMPADISVLEMIEGDWEFPDSEGESLQGRMALVPVLTIKSGEVIPAAGG